MPDRPPVIAMTREPQVIGRSSVSLSYQVEDDYGVTSAEARFSEPQLPASENTQPRRPLVEAPNFPLMLPQAFQEELAVGLSGEKQPAGAQHYLLDSWLAGLGADGRGEAALKAREKEPQEEEEQRTANSVQNRDDRRSRLAYLKQVQVLRSRFGHSGGFLLASSSCRSAKDAGRGNLAQAKHWNFSSFMSLM